jgi:cell division protein FtsB
MTFAQVERAIQFCLDQQAAFWARNAELQESFKQFDARQKELEAGHKILKDELEILKELSRNLLTVAQIHSRRLDRLDGIGPS